LDFIEAFWSQQFERRKRWIRMDGGDAGDSEGKGMKMMMRK
jgi:hypothetical protein